MIQCVQNKLKYFIAFVACVLSLSSFSQQCQEPYCNDIISTDPSAASNTERPSMKNRFDWTTQKLKVYHQGSINFEAGGSYKEIDNPYYSTEEYLQDINFRKLMPQDQTKLGLDFHSNDGWELVHKNDGFNVDQTTFLSDYNRSSPYFILYNKYRGLLRIFSGMPFSLGTNQNIVTQIGRRYSSFDGTFNRASGIISPLDQTPNVNNMAHSDSWSSSPGFIKSDFTVNYDPCICGIQNQYAINFSTANDAKLNLEGRLIGTSVPLSGTGNEDLLNGRDFITQVGQDGFNVNGGSLTYSNIDALTSKFKTLESAESAQNPVTEMFFESVKNGIKGLGEAGDKNINEFASGKALLLYNHYLGGKELIKIKNNDFLQNLATIPIKEKLELSLGLISPAASALTSLLFPAEEKKTKPLPAISFIEAEMKLTGTMSMITKVNQPNFEILFAIPGSKYTTNPIYTPDRYYPSYNEPLGLFSLLETPKATVMYTKTNSVLKPVVIRTNNCEGYSSDNGYYDYIMSLMTGKEELFFQIDKNSIKYVFNKSAEIDETNTVIYASLEIKESGPKKIKDISLKNINLNQQFTKEFEPIVGQIICPCSAGKPAKYDGGCFVNSEQAKCDAITNAIAVTGSLVYNPPSGDNSSATDIVKYYTGIMPLECLANTTQNLKADNLIKYNAVSFRKCRKYDYASGWYDAICDITNTVNNPIQHFTNQKEAYLKLHIEYTFKKNKYGKVNKFFEILTYPIAVTDGTIDLSTAIMSDNVASERTLPADGYTQGSSNNVWDKYTYNGGVTPASLTTLNAGTEHELIAGAELSGEAVLAISDSYLCGAKINPVSDPDVKSFCANNYFGKQYVNNLRLENMIEEERLAKERLPSEFSFNLYPNPSTNHTYVSIVSPSDGNAKLLVKDLSGKTINKFTNELSFGSGTSESSIDVSELQAGAYICQLEVGNKKYIQKLVVVK